MKARKIYVALFFIFLGFSGGLITGVVVDADQIYNTTVKNIKQKKSSGNLVLDVKTDQPIKSKKEIRQESRAQNKEIRKHKRKNN